MEEVLDVYHMPYDSDYPVVCMDESCKQMIGEVREPIPCAPGWPVRIDDEYVRNGVAEIFMGSSLKSMGNVVCNMIEIRHQELEEVDTDRDERHRSFSVGFGFETAVASGVV